MPKEDKPKAPKDVHLMKSKSKLRHVESPDNEIDKDEMMRQAIEEKKAMDKEADQK